MNESTPAVQPDAERLTPDQAQTGAPQVNGTASHGVALLAAAQEFRRNNCCGIPAAGDRPGATDTKQPWPDGPAWKRYQSQPPTEDQLLQWFTGQYTGLGIVTGQISGNLEMLEFEGRAVHEGLLREATDLTAAAGLGDVWSRLIGGYLEATPSDGLHILYRLADMPVPGNTPLATRPAHPDEITDDERERMAKDKAAGRVPRDPVRVLIETRGEGGFVVVAPSYGTVHPTGKPWQLIQGGPATIPTLTADERNSLFQVLASLDQMPEPPATLFAQPGKGGRDFSDDPRPGDRWAEQTDWADILLPRGWKLVCTRGPVRHWLRPGKPRGMSATTGRPPYDNLFNFSTSVGLPHREPLTKFRVLAELDHGGDYRAAAEELVRQGYGTNKEERTKSTLTATTNKEETSPRIGAAPPFADPSMYTGILGDIVEAAAPTTEADPVGIYASLLAGVGVIMNSTPYVRVGNTKHPLLIWPLLLGRTGSGRKGEATGTAEIFLRNAEPEAGAFFVSGLSSGEGLIERIRDKDDDQEAEGGRFRQPGGTDDKRLLVIETEFSSVLARAKREGSTLAAVQRQAWDGRALSVLNRKQLKASASHVAIIGHVTPQEFRLRLAEADMTGGTYNRYLPLYVERSQRLPIPEGVADEVVQDLSIALRRAMGNAARSGQLQLGEEATQLWAGELYDELTAGDDEDLAEAEFTRRAAPYCLRIAGLFTVLDGRRLIGKGDLTAAAAVIRYSIASAKFILDRQARDPRLDRIRRAIDGAGSAGLSRTDISALFSRNLTKAKLDDLLAELVSHDEYEESLQHGRGRPVQTYRHVVSSYFVPKDDQS